MLILLKIAGGIALLLFGVRYLRKGLDRLFGPRIGNWMRRVGDKPGFSFLGGLSMSILAPSSTTISVLAVQSVQAGYLTARQMLSVMLGANIGLTVLVQLIALRLDEFAPVFLAAGFVLFQYSTGARRRGTGQVLMAIGFFFLAVAIIRNAIPADQLGPESDFSTIVGVAEKYPLMLALLAMVMATALQSSTATLGLVIGLGATGVVGTAVAVPVVVGANLGLAVTTLILGWRQIESRRLASANLLLKVLLASVCLLTLSWLTGAIESWPGSLASRVANVHTAFNIALAILGLPLAGLMTALMEKGLPAPRDSQARPFGPKFIHRGPVDSLALATGQSMREIMHMSEIVRSMLQDVWSAMKTNDATLVDRVSDRDDQVDLLDREIKRFLTRLVIEESDQKDAAEQIRQLQYLTELETVGDIIDKNLAELVRKKIRLRARFTPAGERELDDFYQKVMDNQAIADTVFTTRDRTLAQQLMRHQDYLDRYEQELRDRHFARLNAGLAQAHETSAIHLDLLTHLKRINSCITHVAYGVAEENDSAAETSPTTAEPHAQPD